MPQNLILTVIGDDKPGLVEALSQSVTAHQGNWLESRMSHMAGKFAGIVRVEVPDGEANALRHELERLAGLGLKVSVEGAGAAAEPVPAVRLELVGSDHPGIVRDISQILHQRGVNVEELNTACVDAPMSSEALFQANARLRLPSEVSMDDLRDDLEQVAQSLMVEIKLDDD